MSYWLSVTSGDTFETAATVFAFECEDADELEATADWLSKKLRDVCTVEQLQGKIERALKAAGKESEARLD